MLETVLPSGMQVVIDAPVHLTAKTFSDVSYTERDFTLAEIRLVYSALCGNAQPYQWAETQENLITYIKTIGLYRNKAKHVIELSRKLLEDFDGVVPDDREALESLPGVGRKTANVVLNVAFGKPTIAVDTHIFRVSNRTGFAPGKTVEEVERKLLKFMPAQFKKDAHHWLLLHGRYCCKAAKPDCAHCPIAELCEYKKKTL